MKIIWDDTCQKSMKNMLTKNNKRKSFATNAGQVTGNNYFLLAY